MTFDVENITKRFSGLVAVEDFSLQLDNEVVGLMGPNGSGKSTTLNCISGVYEPNEGTIHHNGVDLTGRPIYEFARSGIARTFQTPRVFEELGVLENVMVPLLNDGVPTGIAREAAMDALQDVELTHVKSQEAKAISGGQKKLLEFARTLMLDPDVVLLDEPFAGVHPELETIMRDRIENLRSEGTDFIVVSHEVESLYNISDRILVLDRGELIAEGTPESIQNDDQVIEAYIGGTA